MARGKTLIGVLASHDSRSKNEALSSIFKKWSDTEETKKTLRKFGFVFSGGTYDRLFNNKPVLYQKVEEVKHSLPESVKDFLLKECGVLCLPRTDQGGVTMLASLISLRRLSILWPFFSPLTTHLLFPENLALLRLADQWRVKKLMNSGSVDEWLSGEAKRDYSLNRREIGEKLKLPGSELVVDVKQNEGGVYEFVYPEAQPPDFLAAKDTETLDKVLKKSVVALISHDGMKGRMIDFVTDHESELKKFGKILATGTTGKIVQDAAPSLKELIHPYHSGPKGGDVEIATEILFGGCHVVIFFVDPLNPHPHTEDIRVVFGACMIHDQVRMLSNEVQARDWMKRLIRE